MNMFYRIAPNTIKNHPNTHLPKLIVIASHEAEAKQLFATIFEAKKLIDHEWIDLGTDLVVQASKKSFPSEEDVLLFNEGLLQMKSCMDVVKNVC